MQQPAGARRHVGGGKKIVYVIGTYPNLTTTFIDREIHAARRLGLNLTLIAIRRPQFRIFSPAVQLLMKEVAYLLPVSILRLARAHAVDIYRSPAFLDQKISTAKFTTTCTAFNKSHLDTTSAPAWYQVGVPVPDGAFALLRVSSNEIELCTDILASRALWYAHTEDVFLASTSMRAIVAYLRSFEPDEAARSRVLSAGTLGPGLRIATHCGTASRVQLRSSRN